MAEKHAQCWNAFCVADEHDGNRHVDCTGYGWEQRRGYRYNPDTGEYDAPWPGDGPVFTTYERLV